MKIGILQCGQPLDEIKAKHGDYAAMFRRLLDGHDFTFDSWNVEEMQFPASIHEADGWLLSGSKHGVYDPMPFIAPLEDFVRAAYQAHVPLAGICFGHQLIAQALGGKVQKFSGGWSVGRNLYNFEGAGTVALNAWHQDQVIELPPDATCIASSDFCRNAALVYGDRALTVQPHPEFTSEIVEDMIRVRRGAGVVPDALLERASQASGPALDQPLLGRRIAEFFLAHTQAEPKVAHG